MSETETAAAAALPSYLEAAHGVKSWLLTRDHKRIGILYLISISVFFVLGGLMAVLIRAELATPQAKGGLEVALSDAAPRPASYEGAYDDDLPDVEFHNARNLIVGAVHARPR